MKNRDEVYGAAKQERSLEKGKTAKLSSKRISLHSLYGEDAV